MELLSSPNVGTTHYLSELPTQDGGSVRSQPHSANERDTEDVVVEGTIIG
jgi:hypothetical protein